MRACCLALLVGCGGAPVVAPAAPAPRNPPSAPTVEGTQHLVLAFGEPREVGDRRFVLVGYLDDPDDLQEAVVLVPGHDAVRLEVGQCVGQPSGVYQLVDLTSGRPYPAGPAEATVWWTPPEPVTALVEDRLHILQPGTTYTLEGWRLVLRLLEAPEDDLVQATLEVQSPEDLYPDVLETAVYADGEPLFEVDTPEGDVLVLEAEWTGAVGETGCPDIRAFVRRLAEDDR